MELILRGNAVKHCPTCGKLGKPAIVLNKWFKPHEQGNPWECKHCGEVFVVKDGTSYTEHVELLKEYLANNDEPTDDMIIRS